MNIDEMSAKNRNEILRELYSEVSCGTSLPYPKGSSYLHRPVTKPQQRLGKHLNFHFSEQVKLIGGHITKLNSVDYIPLHIADVLDRENALKVINIGKNRLFNELKWDESGIEVNDAFDIESEHAGITQAVCGVAESGSVVLVSSVENPTYINFLVKYHFVVLFENKLLVYLEDVWRLLRSLNSNHLLPRAVNFVTGPSTTADVESTLVTGVHGPGYFEILLIGNDES